MLNLKWIGWFLIKIKNGILFLIIIVYVIENVLFINLYK